MHNGPDARTVKRMTGVQQMCWLSWLCVYIWLYSLWRHLRCRRLRIVAAHLRTNKRVSTSTARCSRPRRYHPSPTSPIRCLFLTPTRTRRSCSPRSPRTRRARPDSPSGSARSRCCSRCPPRPPSPRCRRRRSSRWPKTLTLTLTLILTLTLTLILTLTLTLTLTSTLTLTRCAHCCRCSTRRGRWRRGRWGSRLTRRRPRST